MPGPPVRNTKAQKLPHMLTRTFSSLKESLKEAGHTEPRWAPPACMAAGAGRAQTILGASEQDGGSLRPTIFATTRGACKTHMKVDHPA